MDSFSIKALDFWTFHNNLVRRDPKGVFGTKNDRFCDFSSPQLYVSGPPLFL